MESCALTKKKDNNEEEEEEKNYDDVFFLSLMHIILRFSYERHAKLNEQNYRLCGPNNYDFSLPRAL